MTLALTPDERPVTVDVVIRMDPMTYRYWSDMQELSQHLVRHFVDNLSKMSEPKGADLFVVVTTRRGEDRGGYVYTNGHFVKDETDVVEAAP